MDHGWSTIKEIFIIDFMENGNSNLVVLKILELEITTRSGSSVVIK